MKLLYDNCPNCFASLEHNEVCPICGFPLEKLIMNPNVLPPFTLLNDRYLLGRVLGQGGFGITYVAQDLRMGRLRAIKEYLPVEYAKRIGVQVTRKDYVNNKVYEHGRQRFLDEASTLVSLKENPTVVDILDFFPANNTAYLVMEYLDGMNLRSEMHRSGGKIDAGYAKLILVTIASSMMEVHRKGVLHRDISPENIFLTKDGDIKLIDFGAARSYVSSQKNGLSVLLKPGFAPPEQYDRYGTQGPWTDVYSLAATFYYAVSGQKLADSIFRQKDPRIVPLSKLEPSVSEQTSKVIKKALELDVRKRYQDFGQFLNELDIQYKHAIQEDKKKAHTKKTLEKPALNTMERSNMETVLLTGGESDGNKYISAAPSGKKKRRFLFGGKKKGVPVVRIMGGRKAGITAEIRPGEVLKIGRSVQKCHIALDYDSNISRVHCLLRYNRHKGQFILLDFSSNNGTYLATGERLKPNIGYPLDPGECFYLVSEGNMLQVDIEKR